LNENENYDKMIFKKELRHNNRFLRDLHGRRISGVLLVGGLKTNWAFAMKGSSLFPRVSIFNPNAHLAITSMVKALNVLPNQSTKFKTGALIQKSKTWMTLLQFGVNFPIFLHESRYSFTQIGNAIFN
jgi:hypothetical protein